MANILVSIEKGVEVAAEDVLKWLTGASSKMQSSTPSALAALGVVFGAVEKVVSDVSADAANPVNILLQPGQLADIKAVWPDVKAFLAEFGVKL